MSSPVFFTITETIAESGNRFPNKKPQRDSTGKLFPDLETRK